MKGEHKFLIYALHHDASNRVYVGKSSSGMRRPLTHFYAAEAKKHPRVPLYNWIGKYRDDVRITVLENCSAESLAEAERFYIAYFKSIGVQLLNCTDGGDGGMSGYKMSQETRAKMSAVHKEIAKAPEHVARFVKIASAFNASEEGREHNRKIISLMHTPEAKAKKSASLKVHAQTPEGKQQIAEAQRKSRTPEALAKLSASKKGKTFSAEHREKLSIAHMGHKRSPESVEKSAAAHRGVSRSPEVVAKMKAGMNTPEARAKKSAALKASWARRKQAKKDGEV